MEIPKDDHNFGGTLIFHTNPNGIHTLPISTLQGSRLDLLSQLLQLPVPLLFPGVVEGLQRV